MQLHLIFAMLAAPTLIVVLFNLIGLANKTWSRRKEGRMLVIYLCLIPLVYFFSHVMAQRYMAQHPRSLSVPVYSQ